MIQVALGLLADCANVSREGKLNILGIFDRLHSQKVPAVHPQMHLVLSFEADRADAEKTHALAIDLIDADGTRLFSLSGELRFGTPPPGEQVRVNQVVQLNSLQFPRFGTYEFKIVVNNEVRRSVPLSVVEAPRPQGC
jgi:hypothetical protein